MYTFEAMSMKNLVCGLTDFKNQLLQVSMELQLGFAFACHFLKPALLSYFLRHFPDCHYFDITKVVFIFAVCRPTAFCPAGLSQLLTRGGEK